MNILLETYYILLPIVATALIGWVGYLLKDQKKKGLEQEEKQAAFAAGIMMVLRYMLRRYHGEYMLQGYITYNQYKDWREMLNVYVSLGGNSVAVAWDKDIQKLEMREAASEVSLYEVALRKGMRSMVGES